MAIRAGNGVVYGIPGKGDQVLQVSGTTATRVGPSFNLTGWRQRLDEEGFVDAVLAANGMIYGIPYNSAEVLKIDPSSGNVAFVGVSFTKDSGSGCTGKNDLCRSDEYPCNLAHYYHAPANHHGCSGKNEICGSTATPCSTVTSLAGCQALCTAGKRICRHRQCSDFFICR